MTRKIRRRKLYKNASPFYSGSGTWRRRGDIKQAAGTEGVRRRGKRRKGENKCV